MDVPEDMSEEDKEKLKNDFPQAEAYGENVAAEYYHEADQAPEGS